MLPNAFSTMTTHFASDGDFTTLARLNHVSTYFDLVALVVLFYDYLTTISDEIELMWGTPWTIGRVLFVLTRYSVYTETTLLNTLHFAKGTTLSVENCHTIYTVTGWFILIGVFIAELVFIFRTYAIWNSSKKLLLGLTAVAIFIGSPAVYTTYKGINGVGFVHVPGYLDCVSVPNQEANRVLLWDFSGVVLFETLIVILTILPTLRQANFRKTNLGATLYKDGLMYYIYLTAFTVGNLFTLGVTSVAMSGMSLVLFQRVIHSVVTSRILLHIRRAGAKDVEVDTETEKIDSLAHGQFSTCFLAPNSYWDDGYQP